MISIRKKIVFPSFPVLIIQSTILPNWFLGVRESPGLAQSGFIAFDADLVFQDVDFVACVTIPIGVVRANFVSNLIDQG